MIRDKKGGSSLLQDSAIQARPFLRWAGGKNWLVRRIADLFGALKFENYHEPFLGGGAFFFSVGSGHQAYLSDFNKELIETYQALRDSVEDVINIMRTFSNTSEFYYLLRGETTECAIRKAAIFIYLNQTSYNGIYRVNLKGVYNVPYGSRTKPFLDADTLRACARSLSGVTLESMDFNSTLKNIRRGDLVFIDPPYTVSHNNNGFIKYNQSLFSIEDQHRLAEYIDDVRSLGAKYILTNAAHVAIKDIFDNGDQRIEVSRASLIGGKKANRGAVSEYIFTNLEVCDGDSERRDVFRSDGGSRGPALNYQG